MKKERPGRIVAMLTRTMTESRQVRVCEAVYGYGYVYGYEYGERA